MTNVTTEQEFDEVMADATGAVLVLFTAPSWCQPCRQFEPHWNKAQTLESLEHFTFVKVDMGESPEDTGEHWAMSRFNIMSVPALLRFSNNGAVYSVVKSRAVVPLIRELTA